MQSMQFIRLQNDLQCGTLWRIVFLRLRNILTYLLTYLLKPYYTHTILRGFESCLSTIAQWP